jgi:hypothetical protein
VNVIHLYLDENNLTPDNREDLRPNGFTPAKTFHDFPIRGQEVLLHVRRRRWLDAEILSLTKMMGQLQDAGNVTTLAGYLEILDQCALLTGLQKYANDEARKRGSIPKYQVYNNALLTAYKGRSFVADRTDTKAWGRWVESAVGAYLLNQADEYDYKLYYWREREDEVDFIIDYNRQCIAIEVKSGRRTNNEGLGVFRDKFHPVQSFVVGSGGVPLDEFLTWNIGDLIE